jgi:hypothetical protein
MLNVSCYTSNQETSLNCLSAFSSCLNTGALTMFRVNAMFSVIISSKNFYVFCTMSRIILSHISKLFTANKLALSLDKTNTMKFITNYSPQYTLKIGHIEKYIEASVNTKFLRLQIDNWRNNINQMINELSVACCAVRSMFHISNNDTLKSICFTDFYSIVKYGKLVGDNSSNS